MRPLFQLPQGPYELTPGLRLTYIRSMEKQFRHIYRHPSNRTPYHFRFAVSSAVFKDPMLLGRPAGVFRADCWGVTPVSCPDRDALFNSPSFAGKRDLVDEGFEPNTAARFPRSCSFQTKEEAALECDFWKLVLLKRFFLEIPFSHGSLSEYIEAARVTPGLMDPYVRLNDENQWSHELLDFIAQHREKLWQHRDANKPELDLDAFESWAREHNDRDLLVWVACIRDAQKSLEQFSGSNPESTVVGRLQTVLKYLDHVLDARTPEARYGSRFFSRLNQFSNSLQSLRSVRDAAVTLLTDIESERQRLKTELNTLVSNRPPPTPSNEPLGDFRVTV